MSRQVEVGAVGVKGSWKSLGAIFGTPGVLSRHSWGFLRVLSGGLEVLLGLLVRSGKKTGMVNQFSPTLRGSERASWDPLGLLLACHQLLLGLSWGLSWAVWELS